MSQSETEKENDKETVDEDTEAQVKSTDESHLLSNKDVDEAMKFANELDDNSIDTKADTKLYWKINFYLLPLICLLYACQYMDKVTSSYAAIVSINNIQSYSIHYILTY